jgi:hypothetical protein
LLVLRGVSYHQEVNAIPTITGARRWGLDNHAGEGVWNGIVISLSYDIFVNGEPRTRNLHSSVRLALKMDLSLRRNRNEIHG